MKIYTKEEALARAQEYGLQAEVRYCMERMGYSPNEHE